MPANNKAPSSALIKPPACKTAKMPNCTLSPPAPAGVPNVKMATVGASSAAVGATGMQDKRTMVRINLFILALSFTEYFA